MNSGRPSRSSPSPPTIRSTTPPGVNNWSGQPQGLTYQRAIGALENYGHFAEVTRLGQKLLPVLIRNGCTFPQQLDAITGKPSGPKPDGYGPMILAALEYISRMHGIHLDVERNRVWWSAVDPAGHDFTSTQRWGEHNFRLSCKDGEFQGFVGDRLCLLLQRRHPRGDRSGRQGIGSRRHFPGQPEGDSRHRTGDQPANSHAEFVQP